MCRRGLHRKPAQFPIHQQLRCVAELAYQPLLQRSRRSLTCIRFYYLEDYRRPLFMYLDVMNAQSNSLSDKLDVFISREPVKKI